MNAVLVREEPQPDGRVFVTTRALRLQETIYVKRKDDEVVDAEKDLIMHGGWQPGREAKAEITKLVREGMDLDHAFWQVCVGEEEARVHVEEI